MDSRNFIIIWVGFVMLWGGEQEMVYPGSTQERLFCANQNYSEVPPHTSQNGHDSKVYK